MFEWIVVALILAVFFGVEWMDDRKRARRNSEGE
jgi:hypothetical protein